MLPSPGSTPAPSSLPPDLAEKVRTAPLDQLPELLHAQAEKTYRAALGDRDPPPEEPPTPEVPGASSGMPIDPQLIQQATTILAQEGLLPGPTTELTPDVLAVIEGLAQADGPGLSDLSQPEQVEEILRGVIDGHLGRATSDGGRGTMGGPPGGIGG